MKQVGQRSRVAVLASSAAAKSGCESAERQDGASSIVYIDRCALTRDCIANELAMLLLPEFALAAFSDVGEIGRDAGRLKRFCCAIYHSHSFPIEAASVVGDLRRIHEVLTGIRIVMLSNLEVTANVIGAMRQGVAGYIPTSLSLKIASEAVRLVLAGGTFIPASALSLTVRSEPPGGRGFFNGAPGSVGLTPRQNQVLHYLCKGKPNKAIAHELGMSEGTVKVHVKHIMKRLGVHNRTQIVLITRQMFGESQPVEAEEIPSIQPVLVASSAASAR